ncbi:hypothetical protein JYU20_00725 [Bacteroidales bacterium AH-315-I05]|nr:hypothetical protein [Bacteroidales bacterium AH-315-I05]
MQRQLTDRIEIYNKIIEGECSCGELVHKVLSSNCTNWKNGDRYHYPNEKTAVCIFRCKNCGDVIHDTFKETESQVRARFSDGIIN